MDKKIIILTGLAALFMLPNIYCMNEERQDENKNLTKIFEEKALLQKKRTNNRYKHTYFGQKKKTNNKYRHTYFGQKKYQPKRKYFCKATHIFSPKTRSQFGGHIQRPHSHSPKKTTYHNKYHNEKRKIQSCDDLENLLKEIDTKVYKTEQKQDTIEQHSDQKLSLATYPLLIPASLVWLERYDRNSLKKSACFKGCEKNSLQEIDNETGYQEEDIVTWIMKQLEEN